MKEKKQRELSQEVLVMNRFLVSCFAQPLPEPERVQERAQERASESHRDSLLLGSERGYCAPALYPGLVEGVVSMV